MRCHWLRIYWTPTKYLGKQIARLQMMVTMQPVLRFRRKLSSMYVCRHGMVLPDFILKFWSIFAPLYQFFDYCCCCFSTGTLQGDECSRANPGIIQLRNCTKAFLRSPRWLCYSICIGKVVWSFMFCWTCRFILGACLVCLGLNSSLTLAKSQNPTNCGWGGSFQSYLTHS